MSLLNAEVLTLAKRIACNVLKREGIMELVKPIESFQVCLLTSRPLFSSSVDICRLPSLSER